MILSECHLADLISLYVGIDAMLVMNYSNSPSNDIWGRGHAQHLPPTNCKQNCKSAQDSHQFSSPSQKTVIALQRGALLTTVFPQLLLPQCIHTMFKADSLSVPTKISRLQKINCFRGIQFLPIFPSTSGLHSTGPRHLYLILHSQASTL